MNCGPTWIQCPSFAPLEKGGCLVNDLSGHTHYCGSECKLFHLGSLVYNSLYSALAACRLLSLVVSVYTLCVETTVYLCFVWQTSTHAHAAPWFAVACCLFPRATAKGSSEKSSCEFTSSHLTSSHLTSSHLTSSHLTSSHLTSSHLTSSHLTSSNLLLISHPQILGL